MEHAVAKSYMRKCANIFNHIYEEAVSHDFATAPF